MQIHIPVGDIEPGMTILLAAGERVPVDARVTKGRSELDCSLVSGESAPQPADEGTLLQAGTLNLTGPIEIIATAPAKDSFLAEMARMMEAAEAGRSTYRRIADRASRLYAPVVHATAFLTFAGWMIASGDLHRSITIAIAVLIVTCPCALGLAVPMVHVVAARRLFDKGIMIKDGGALERLANVDAVIFDKTGKLTTARPRLVSVNEADTNALAAAIAAHSRHPYAQALLEPSDGRRNVVFNTVSEHPGMGLEARHGSDVYRLGRPDWAVAEPGFAAEDDEVPVVLSTNGRCTAEFHLDDNLRPGAREAIADLTAFGLGVTILSGDNDRRVLKIAERCGVSYAAGARPADKVRHIAALKTAGSKILMVGDGLNDAPALSAADVSMAPGSAADIGRNAADLVFLRESLAAVPQAIAVAREAGQRVRQNFALAITYNIVAIPVAVLGQLTPLLAAIAMSLSSIIVVANALRPDFGSRLRRPAAQAGRVDQTASPTPGPVT
jgi:P-type Cu2+ transporter